MLEEFLFEFGLSLNQAIFALVISIILNLLFAKYVLFPFMDKHKGFFLRYSPLIIVVIHVGILIYIEAYTVVMVVIIWALFVKIVLNSNKYPKLNDAIDSFFFGAGRS
jgi:hypothetical protein